MAHSANDVAGHNEAGISGTSMEIKIKTSDSQMYSLQVDKQMPVPVLKEHIASVTGVLTEHQRLICHEKDLQDDQLLSAYHVEDGHIVHLVVQELNASSSGSLPADPVCSFVRKPIRNKNIRKRTTDEIEDGSEDSSVLPAGKRSVKTDSKLYFSSGTSKRSLPAEATDDSQNVLFHYESSKEIQIQNDSKATATLETETDFSRDARAIRERALKQAEEGLKGKNKTADGEKVYKGMHSYTDYRAGFRREQTVAAEKAGGAHGPLRASAHIRVSARFDYQPDICKDYKETGYCGYGDSCKFMHDRGDYKSGWQMEKEWDEAEKTRKRNLALKGHDSDEDNAVYEEEDDDNGLPFACFICRQPFVDPVMTKCKHYFCEHCALKHHSRNKKCFVCNQPTLGIFNTAHEIRKRMAADKK